MSHGDSGDTSGFWRIVDRLTAFGLKIGGLVFIVLTAYLVWGIHNGNWTGTGSLKGSELAHALMQIQFLLKVLVASGVVLFVSAAFQFYGEQITGYLLLLTGGLLRWGVPALAGALSEKISLAADSVPAHIIGQYVLLGMVALGVAAPLILLDVWERLRGTRRWLTKGASGTAERAGPGSGLRYFCWQTPHCRDNIRGVCPAYQRKMPCWWLKSGCYCDEEKLLRLIIRSDPNVPSAARPLPLSDNLSPATKRRRCRECVLYRDHQQLKYKLLSPLVFPAAVAIMYYGFKTIRHYVHTALKLSDEFAKHVTFVPSSPSGSGPSWTHVSATSSTVEWIFIGLVGLLLLTYMLRLLEYLIFDLQI